MREAEVVAALTGRLTARLGPDALLIPELGLCQAEARIDLAVVSGHLTGWEVKSSHDTLARLPRQEPVYSRIFDRVWLAADARHIESATKMIPTWWGVTAITEGPDGVRFRTVRESRINRQIDLHSVVRLLWREEVLDELDRLGLAAGHFRSPRRILWEILANAAPRQVSPTELRARVRRRIKSRRGWRSDAPQE